MLAIQVVFALFVYFVLGAVFIKCLMRIKMIAEASQCEDSFERFFGIVLVWLGWPVFLAFLVVGFTVFLLWKFVFWLGEQEGQ